MKKIFYLIIILSISFIILGCENNTNKVNTEIKEDPIPISDEIINNISNTKTIIIKNMEYDEKAGVDKASEEPKEIITTKDEVEEIILIISTAIKITGDVNYVGISNSIEMYDNEKLLENIFIAIWYSETGGNIYIIINNDYYELPSENNNRLLEIMER